MKTKFSALAITAMMALVAVSVTGCDRGGDTKHADKKVNTPQMYQFTANCSGGDCAKKHANKIVLTYVTCQGDTVQLNDFWISVGDFNCKVGATSSADWGNTPEKGGKTKVTGLYWQAGSSKSAIDGTITWNSLDFDNDGKAEGNATFTY